MPSNSNQFSGLTKLILDCLWSLRAELLEDGQEWTQDLMDQVEYQVRVRLFPLDKTPREQMIFDMVFKRAFGEARDICLAMNQITGLKSNAEMLKAHFAPA